MVLTKLSAVTLGVFLLCCGCDNSPIIGKYTGHQQLAKDTPAHIVNTLGPVVLDLKRDRTFTYIRLSMPWEGTWRTENDKVILTITSALNKPSSSEQEVILTLKGQDLVLTDADTQTPILLKKGETSQ